MLPVSHGVQKQPMDLIQIYFDRFQVQSTCHGTSAILFVYRLCFTCVAPRLFRKILLSVYEVNFFTSICHPCDCSRGEGVRSSRAAESQGAENWVAK
jgi:hypothetical protein